MEPKMKELDLSNVPTASFDEVADLEFIARQTGPNSLMQSAGDVGSQLLQGLTLGFADEAIGGVAGLGDYILGRSDSLGSAVDKRIAQERARQRVFDQNSGSVGIPFTGLEVTGADALQFGGGVLTGVAGMGKAATTKAPGLMKALMGTPMRAGATTGAVAGAGNADGGAVDRALGATGGALTGALMGKTLDTGARTVGKVVNKLKGENAAPIIEDSASRLIGRKLANSTDDDILAAANRVQKARAGGQQMTATEALDTESGHRFMQYLGNDQGSRDDVQRFMENRALGADDMTSVYKRVTEKLDKISSTKGTLATGQRGSKAAKAILEELADSRSKAVTPLYKDAYKTGQITKTPELRKLLKNSYMERALTEARKDLDLGEKVSKTITVKGKPVTKQVYKYANNDIRVLDRAKRYMDDLIASESDKVKRGTATGTKERELNKVNSALKSLLKDSSEAYEEATGTFARMSEPIDRIADLNVRTIANLPETRIAQAGRKLFELHPDQIREVKSSFGGKYDEDFFALVRGGLEDIIERQGDPNKIDLAGKMLKGNNLEKLKAALPRGVFRDVKEFLKNESLMHKGRIKTYAGSPTNPLQDERAANRGLPEKLLSLITLRFMQLAGSASGAITGGRNQRIANRLVNEPAEALSRELARRQGQKALQPFSDSAAAGVSGAVASMYGD